MSKMNFYASKAKERLLNENLRNFYNELKIASRTMDNEKRNKNFYNNYIKMQQK